MKWRCFHCSEVFTNRVHAAEHFGANESETAACKLTHSEGHLVTYIRKLQKELDTYHHEDSDILRAILSLEAEHSQALIREEEKGFARGVEDMKKHGYVLAHKPTSHGANMIGKTTVTSTGPAQFDPTLERGNLPWPADYVMLVCPKPAEAVLELGEMVVPKECRLCRVMVLARSESIAKALATRKILKKTVIDFFCIPCATKHDPNSIDVLHDLRS